MREQPRRGTGWLGRKVRADKTRQFPVESQILRYPARIPLPPFGLVTIRPLPVAKVETAEGCQRLSMVMFDQGALPPHQWPPLHTPTVTELAILGRRRIKIRIESAAGNVAVSAASHIVARKKIGVRRSAVEVFVNHLEDELARFGERIFFQSVEGGAANHGFGVFAQGVDEFFQPRWRGQAVVIRESEEFTARFGNATIARSGWAGVFLMDQLQ